MKHLEYPHQEIWKKRQEWFDNRISEYESIGGYNLSEQACALVLEVQSCYCVGAWLSVIILAFTVIDAQLRETEFLNFKGNSKSLIDSLGFDKRFQNLRIRRNKLVHIINDRPAITVDQQWENSEELEKEATDAVNLMLEAFFSNPMV